MLTFCRCSRSTASLSTSTTQTDHPCKVRLVGSCAEAPCDRREGFKVVEVVDIVCMANQNEVKIKSARTSPRISSARQEEVFTSISSVSPCRRGSTHAVGSQVPIHATAVSSFDVRAQFATIEARDDDVNNYFASRSVCRQPFASTGQRSSKTFQWKSVLSQPSGRFGPTLTGPLISTIAR